LIPFGLVPPFPDHEALSLPRRTRTENCFADPLAELLRPGQSIELLKNCTIPDA